MGFADKERSYDKEPNSTRIACLGASTTYGTFNWPPRLQKILDKQCATKYEVLNFGVQGWTTAESLVNYALLVKQFKPDIVLVHHAINDGFARLYHTMEPDYSHFRNTYCEHIIARPPIDFGFIQSFRVYMWIRSVLLPLNSQLDFRNIMIAPDNPDNPFQNPWTGKPFKELYINPRMDLFERNINTMIDLIRGDGAVPVLITMPYSLKSWPNMTAELTKELVSPANEVLRNIARTRDVALIDLDKEITGKEDMFSDFVHLNMDGRQVKAQMIFDALKSLGLVCRVN
jgi:lysophospholipase L1-like esterase